MLPLQRRLRLYDSSDFSTLNDLPGDGSPAYGFLEYTPPERRFWKCRVSPAEFVAHLLALDGVTDAALIGRTGEPLEPLAETQPLAAIKEALAACLSSDRVLAELLGAETPTQTVLEFGSERVLFTLSAELAGEPCRVVTLCSAQDLSRVRFGLRRLLPQAAPIAADAYTS